MATRTTATKAASTKSQPEGDSGGIDALHRNDVVLVGRLAAPAEERALPSGDLILTWRLVVNRPAPPRPPARRAPTVDTLDCVAWRGDIRRTAASWAVGDTVELSGAMRRRFWRGSTGPVSRTEVEVVRARRLARAR